MGTLLSAIATVGSPSILTYRVNFPPYFIDSACALRRGHVEPSRLYTIAIYSFGVILDATQIFVDISSNRRESSIAID